MKPLMYKVVLTARAIRDIERMDKAIRETIAAKLKQYAQDPIPHARKLSNPATGTWRFRIGQYRAIFDIDNDTIVVLRLGHRRGICR